jgi:hypothetical protein
MLTRLYNRIAQEVAYEIVTPNEARKLCGLEPLQQEDTRVPKKSSKITNCVNCGAVIDPSVNRCEYCGTSYALMGVSCPSKEAECLKIENKLLESKINALQKFDDAMMTMRSYVRHY